MILRLPEEAYVVKTPRGYMRCCDESPGFTHQISEASRWPTLYQADSVADTYTRQTGELAQPIAVHK
jgi:hypothetical protein